MKTSKSQRTGSAKALYTPPTVVDYGSVAKLTQTGNGSGADGGAVAGMTMTCL